MSMILPNKGNRFVAFFDILGFSDLLPVYREKIYSYLETIENNCVSPGIKFLVFSDNTVIYSSVVKDADGSIRVDPKLEFDNIVRTCSTLFFELLMQGIPIRGAISYGEIEIGPANEQSIILGDPIIEAVNYEKEQNWIGFAIAPSVFSQKNVEVAQLFDYINSNSLNTLSFHSVEGMRLVTPDSRMDLIHLLEIYKNSGSFFRLAKCKIPMKNGDIDGFAVIPISRGNLRYIGMGEQYSNLEKLHEKINFLKLCASDKKNQLKYKNTQDLLAQCIIYYFNMAETFHGHIDYDSDAKGQLDYIVRNFKRPDK